MIEDVVIMSQWMCRYGRGLRVAVPERYGISSFTQAILQGKAAVLLEHNVDKVMMPGGGAQIVARNGR